MTKDLATQWARAFIKQALSDRRTYEFLVGANLPPCHSLHYLQMFLEKLAKAYVYANTRDPAELDSLQRSHKVIARTLPAIYRDRRLRELKGQNERLQREMSFIRKLSDQLDLLSPAVDLNAQRRDNTEYPWATDDSETPSIHIPSEWTFPVSTLLAEPLSVRFIKVCYNMASELRDNFA